MSEIVSRRAFAWLSKAGEATVMPQTSPKDRTKEYVPVATGTSVSGSAAKVDGNVAVNTSPMPAEARICNAAHLPVLELMLSVENRPSPTAHSANPAKCSGL